MQSTISIVGGVARLPEWRLSAPIDLDIHAGEQLAITGDNGSGKTKLADILSGKHPLFGDSPKYDFRPSERTLVSDNIRYITFKDSYGASNDRTYYLQQRWNQQEIDAETPTVDDKLEEALLATSLDAPHREQEKERVVALFRLEALLDKYIILLSSGELRKLKLACSLVGRPRILMIDNPFVGLDADTRNSLSTLLGEIATSGDLQIILIVSKDNDIPPFITHVVNMDQGHTGPKMSVEEYKRWKSSISTSRCQHDDIHDRVLSLPIHDGPNADEVIRMNHVTIRYGNRTIINQLDWVVKNGERWVLRGKNGSGKSTLLSLVCADNPQGYACDISLFGHRRGSGESIWDIKKHIGYVSPEMHRAYKKNLPVVEVVASGLKDSIGLYAKPTSEEYATCMWWLSTFGIDALGSRGFLSLSEGEQRLVLLTRAFVKDPSLLILDEPFHGLDDANRALSKTIINAFCERPGKTLLFVTHYDDEMPGGNLFIKELKN